MLQSFIRIYISVDSSFMELTKQVNLYSDIVSREYTPCACFRAKTLYILTRNH